MKSIPEQKVQDLIKECIDEFGEYEKVKFAVKIKGKDTILSGFRLIDKTDNEYFIVKDKNQAHFLFEAKEVIGFERLSVVQPEEEVNYNPASQLQKTIASKIQREKEKTMQESQEMAETLASKVGYFPLLNSASVNGLTIDFLNANKELETTIFFQFIKGETYQVYSHEDEREIDVNSLMVDVSIATTKDGEEVSQELFAKYYETYATIQDLEFIPDDKYTQEIFNTYRLNEKHAKVVGDLNKHDLLELVTENSNDPNIIAVAKELRNQKKPSNKMKP